MTATKKRIFIAFLLAMVLCLSSFLFIQAPEENVQANEVYYDYWVDYELTLQNELIQFSLFQDERNSLPYPVTREYEYTFTRFCTYESEPLDNDQYMFLNYAIWVLIGDSYFGLDYPFIDTYEIELMIPALSMPPAFANTTYRDTYCFTLYTNNPNLPSEVFITVYYYTITWTVR